MQYFPTDFPNFGFLYILDNVEDQTLKQEADQWYSDFIVNMFPIPGVLYEPMRSQGLLP